MITGLLGPGAVVFVALVWFGGCAACAPERSVWWALFWPWHLGYRVGRWLARSEDPE